MTSQISDSELERKSIEELSKMLADETLFPLDDDTKSDLILRITEVIIRKESKTDEQHETERVAFWARLIVNHGNKLPIRLEDVLKKDNVIDEKKQFSSFKYHETLTKMIIRRIAIVVVILLFMGNTISTYAFNYNFLNVIIGYTSDVFNKRLVTKSSNEEENHSGILLQDIDSNMYESFQDALNVYGITEVKAPLWIPSNYNYAGVQLSDTSDRDIIVSVYKSGEKMIVVTVINYSEIPSGQTRTFEKSEGSPLIFTYNGIDHYIFSNLEKITATWINGLTECDIHGDISLEEIKLMIESMYMED